MSSAIGPDTEDAVASLRETRTAVVGVIGASMAPTLPVGSRVVIGAAQIPAILPGDVVLFAGSPHPVIHRVLFVACAGSRSVVFHRGDAGGGIGVADGSAVLGKVVAVLAPTPGPAPAFLALPPRLRRSFTRAQWVAHLAALARRLGVRRRVLPGWVRWAAARLMS